LPKIKDYTLSLNRGLFNSFHNKFPKEVYDFIKDRVSDSEIPTDEYKLHEWAIDLVNEAVDGRFKDNLVKQIVKSLKDAPRKNPDDPAFKR
jgi:hypothetical protein